MDTRSRTVRREAALWRWGIVWILLSSCSGGTTPGPGMDGGDAVGTLDIIDARADGSGEVDRGEDQASSLDLVDLPDEQWGLDLETVAEIDSGWEIQPGEAGYECTKNSECLSGFCILTPEGRQCTVLCTEECPFDWECVLYTESLPDELYICAPGNMNLCKPCGTNNDCSTNGVSAGDWCVAYGAQGNFCASPCGGPGDCPAGYSCSEATSLTGESGPVCLLAGGECECTDWWADEGAATECYIASEWGTCYGERTCTAAGLSACDAATPEAESCDTLDNDCDGLVDEETGGSECQVESEHGTCPGTTKCTAGELICDGPMPVPEVCDGLDNDCDGETDEGFPDTDLDGVADCMEQDKDDDGVVDGEDNCPGVANSDQADHDLDGAGDLCDLDDDNDQVADELDCEPFDKLIYPGAPEVCDAVDNNCNDEIDEGLGETTCGKGECLHTVANCLAGESQECDPFEGIAEEVCDGLDNDCNGLVDESLGETTCGKGECLHAAANCIAGVPQLCDPFEGAVAEVCDGLDNDCDGLADNGLGQTTCGLGECQHTVANCLEGVPQECDPFAGVAEEVCDGQDNDCDGETDEQLGQLACGQGECFHTVPQCLAGVPQECDPFAGVVAEVCDGLDNDCDGETDEGMPDIACGLGECLHTVPGCVDGVVPSCDPLAGAVAEVCDGLDNDCDGDTDEELGELACGLGECFHVLAACVGGEPQVCDPLAGAVAEVCDGLDNDCDGNTDEELGELACGEGICFHTVPACEDGEEQVCDPFAGVEDETCDGLDNDCDGVVDNPDLVCVGCQAGMCALAGLSDGSLSPGQDLRYQYAPVTPGDGFVRANWESVAGAAGYRLRIGTSPLGDDVLPDKDVGNVTAYEATGLTLVGAWDDVVYHVSVWPLGDAGELGAGAVSNGVAIAEAVAWDGESTDGLYGGYSVDWPEPGFTTFYGRHYFETVTIGEGTVVRVQGWGKVDGVGESIAADAVAVTDPQDGWLEIYANTMAVAGTVTASGRGYGGGGGGGGGSVAAANRGHGGTGGLGGNGASGIGQGSGGGGGGSPGGQGGYGSQGIGGDGNQYGGGSGSTSCNGNDGRDGGDGPVGEVGGTGGTASSTNVGLGGTGEFGPGGANGAVGCDNWTGGGGGGYGGGGSGGTQWSGAGLDAGGGGGGGSGGVGGGKTAHGGAGTGPFGGAAGGANASAGGAGGYLAAGENGDESTDRSLALGSGGGGGGTGYQESGGGGGGAGGGWLVLYAAKALDLSATARVLANGAGGGGGSRDDGGSSTSYPGGHGAGGGIRLEAASLHVDEAAHLSCRGGNGTTANGGTIKLFYGLFSGTQPAVDRAGRVYDAGEGSFE